MDENKINELSLSVSSVVGSCDSKENGNNPVVFVLAAATIIPHENTKC